MEKMKGNILVNDPSFTDWGYAVLDWHGQVLEAGCFQTEPEIKKRRIREMDDTMRRANDISNFINGLIEEKNIQYILTEIVHGTQSAKAAKLLGMCSGIILSAAVSHHLGVEWYMEWDAKYYLFNRRKVTKEEVINKVKEIFGGKMQYWTEKKGKDEHIADALAVYLVAKNQSPALKLMKTL